MDSKPLNTLILDGYTAVITYDSEIDIFRGEFVGLNGGADFFATSLEQLKAEGRISLRVYLDACQRNGRPVLKELSGKFTLRPGPDLHRRMAIAAQASGKSLSAWAQDILSAHC